MRIVRPALGTYATLRQVAGRDGSAGDRSRIRELFAQCVFEDWLPAGRTFSRIRPESAAKLVRECAYIEQGRSEKVGARRRLLFDQMKQDAALR